MTEDIGERVRKFRKQKKWTMVELADIIGISQSALSAIETGKSKPSGETVLSFLNKTDIYPKYLLEGEGPIIDPRGGASTIIEVDVEKSKKPEPVREKYIEVPVFSMLGAGNLANLEEHNPEMIAYIPERVHAPGVFYFSVMGNSLEPYVLKGAVVGIDTHNKTLLDGEIYAINFHPVGASLKFVQMAREGYVFYSANRDMHRDIEVSYGEMEEEGDKIVMGKLKYLQQVY